MPQTGPNKRRTEKPTVNRLLVLVAVLVAATALGVWLGNFQETYLNGTTL